LHCRFVDVDGVPRRLAVAPRPVEWAVTPIDDVGDTDAEVLAAIADRCGRPVQESAWPPLRAEIIQGTPSYVIVVFHHLVADGWSIDLVRKELRHLYRSALGEERRSLPRVGSFTDYAHLQRAEFADPAAVEAELEAWRTGMDGRPLMPRFPIDLRDRAASLKPRREIRHLLAAPALARFERRCYLAGTTLFAGIAAAYGHALLVATGSNDVSALVPFANRDDEHWDHTVGWLADVTPYYARTPESDRFADHVLAANVGLRNMLGCSRLPFAVAMYHLDPVTYSGGGDQYPTCVLSLQYDAPDTSTDPLDWTPLVSAPDEGSASYRMWFHRTTADGLRLASTALCDPVFDRIEATLAAVLDRWSSEPDALAGDVSPDQWMSGTR
jgi:hypothetical protein